MARPKTVVARIHIRPAKGNRPNPAAFSNCSVNRPTEDMPATSITSITLEHNLEFDVGVALNKCSADGAPAEISSSRPRNKGHATANSLMPKKRRRSEATPMDLSYY